MRSSIGFYCWSARIMHTPYTLNGLPRILLLQFYFLFFLLLFYAIKWLQCVIRTTYATIKLEKKSSNATMQRKHNMRCQMFAQNYKRFVGMAFMRVHYLSISWMLMNNFNGHLNIHLHTNVTSFYRVRAHNRKERESLVEFFGRSKWAIQAIQR